MRNVPRSKKRIKSSSSMYRKKLGNGKIRKEAMHDIYYIGRGRWGEKFVYVGILFVRLFCTSDYEIKFYILKRKNEWMAFESMHGDIFFFFFSKFRKVLSFFFFFLLIDNKYIILFEGDKREILKLEFCWEILSMDENLVFLDLSMTFI